MAQVLVIGSYAREQALAWKLAQSSSVDKVYVVPGNAGSRGNIENVDIAVDDIPELVEFAKANDIAVTVIGPEASAAAGVADAFQAAGLTIFGPTKAAAKIESSKAFSKDLMAAQNIPTAEYKNFTDPQAALAYAKSRSLPVVLKADGLAGGKGVLICYTPEEVEAAVNEIMVAKEFGTAGDQVVVEDFLKGREASFHAITDGEHSAIFPFSQDHKQIYDGDKGPNTGGMGAYAPVEWITPALLEQINKSIVQPALDGLRDLGATFKGCLYPGLMIDGNNIKVLEFNARFGDPEAEVYMRLLDSDLYEVLKACAEGRLDPSKVGWNTGFAVSVVMASGGYPGDYQRGLPITGIEEAEKLDDIVVFHAGTAIKDGRLVTAGGRVLNVTATGATLQEALDKAYAAVDLIHFEGAHFRTDIGRRPIG
ncbi:MAG TPA: phosphoribosylamine--glycine ligase [Candidatus Saccharimonadales bacterium]|jgi:phosphoribosylamine--glycine ligase|nr:phosphoribosylamine--glycine ligase [Candidatus Saccharimonadales bacterium]